MARDKSDAEAMVGCVSVGVAFALLMSLLVGGCVIENSNQQWHAGTVLEKYIKRVDDRDAFFVVLQTAEKKEIFSIRDRAWWWQFGSADIYASLNVGQKVRVKTIGYRVQFLSWYENVVESMPAALE